MLLNNVELSWVKLDRTKPDMGYDKNSPQYSLTVSTNVKSDADAWKKAGINIKPKEDNGKISYSATIKKKIYKDETGKYITPAPVVVDAQLQPITDVNKIGNGSIGNVQVKFKPYEYMGKKGTSIQLLALQITKLVEYTGGSDSLEFSTLNTDKEII
jgi:hypothetical protein